MGNLHHTILTLMGFIVLNGSICLSDFAIPIYKNFKAKNPFLDYDSSEQIVSAELFDEGVEKRAADDPGLIFEESNHPLKAREIYQSRKPLCEELRKQVPLGTGGEYGEHGYHYIPRHIQTVTCVGARETSYEATRTCPAENCVQIVGDVHVIRKQKGDGGSCYSLFVLRNIPQACECQALVSQYGGDRRKKFHPKYNEGLVGYD